MNNVKKEIEISEDEKTYDDYMQEHIEKIDNLPPEEKKQYDLYIKRVGPRPIDDAQLEIFTKQTKIPEGEVIQGPVTGYASIDKPWLFKYTDEEISKNIDIDNFYEYLLNSSIDYPNEIAFDFEGVQVNKRKLFQEICRVEDMLKNEKNITPGDLVCVAPINQPESIYTIYALRKIGAKVSIIDPRANSFTLKNDILESKIKPKLIIASSTAKDEYLKIKDEVKIDTIFVSPFQTIKNKPIAKIIEFTNKLKFGKKFGPETSYDNVMRKYTNKYYKIETVKSFYKDDVKKEKDFDFIMHTGGTTGVHKGVELKDKAFNNTVMEHNSLMDGIVFRGDCLVNPMPQFITYGLTTMHLSLCKGFNMKMLLIPTAKSFAKAIIDNRARLAFGGPIHWEGFMEIVNKKYKKMELDFLRVAVAGGEKVHLSVKERINQFFKEHNNQNILIDGYGLSEVTGVFSVALNENTIGSQGQPLSHNKAASFDRNTGKEIPIGQVGELYVSSDSMMNQYHENEAETNKVFYTERSEKMLKTGDAGYINELGEVNVIGRFKRIFVCGVDKVYQETMEEVICSLPFVKKCVITEIPVFNKELKAVPKAHIVIDKEYENMLSQKQMENEINRIVTEKISDKVYPRFYEFQDASTILYTPNGKVDFSNMTKNDQIELNEMYPTVVRPFEQVDHFASNINNEEEKCNVSKVR